MLVRAAEWWGRLDTIPRGRKRPFMPCKCGGGGRQNHEPSRLGSEGGDVTSSLAASMGQPPIWYELPIGRSSGLVPGHSASRKAIPPLGTCPAGCPRRSHSQPPLPTRGACPGADSEQSVACHGMVFSMDFQETKKETKSKRKNEGAG